MISKLSSASSEFKVLDDHAREGWLTCLSRVLDLATQRKPYLSNNARPLLSIAFGGTVDGKGYGPFQQRLAVEVDK